MYSLNLIRIFEETSGFLRISSFDFDAFPEGDHPFDVIRSLFWRGVKPSSVWILLAVDYQIVIVTFAFPGTVRNLVLFAWFEVLLLQGFSWEVMVVLNNHRII